MQTGLVYSVSPEYAQPLLVQIRVQVTLISKSFYPLTILHPSSLHHQLGTTTSNLQIKKHISNILNFETNLPASNLSTSLMTCLLTLIERSKMELTSNGQEAHTWTDSQMKLAEAVLRYSDQALFQAVSALSSFLRRDGSLKISSCYPYRNL